MQRLTESDLEALGTAQFTCNFVNAPVQCTIRDLRCDAIGQMVDLRATVTRTTEVRPELRQATFQCSVCGSVLAPVSQQYKYTEPAVCTAADCSNKLSWALNFELSTFNDWQKLHVQENANEIPPGSMPRRIDVVVRNSLVETCKPGDSVTITGCLAACPDVPALMKPGDIPKSVTRDKNRKLANELNAADNEVRGLKSIGVRDLGYKLVFLASNVRVANPSLAVDVEDVEVRALGLKSLLLSTCQRRKFRAIVESGQCIERLARSVAPEVHGHESIKSGLLFLLASGVEKRTGREGMKLRGDINMCIVGDPGTAKSQLLKWVHQFAPRAVYASGKTSSAAGLTASVQRDQESSGNAVIEAGALMLADMGVCCIDEFDRMADQDIVAIHEAMEQQTISIAKAGIQATLHARASVIAACNPRSGRYDPSKTFAQNVRLSAPILSRFDMCFIMMDDTENDDLVGRHIVSLHADPEGFSGVSTNPHVLSADDLRLYVKLAKQMKPQLSLEAARELSKAYVTLRQSDSQPGHQRSMRMTVRQLEALVRLSEAAAKLHFAEFVTADHVNAARNVFSASLSHVKRGNLDLDELDDLELEEDENKAPDSAKPEVTIDEYIRLSQAIAGYVNENAGLEDDVVEKQQLLTCLLQEVLPAQTEEDLHKNYVLLWYVLNRMVTKDFILIEEVMTLADGEEVECLRLHPNYAPNSENCDPRRRTRHATLPVDFVESPDAEQVLPEVDPDLLDAYYDDF
ncbi:MAG: hypothetical protein KVP17_002937 [Porospora cf. gigantea B]|uniref:uncharacterized protein n=1 Tax=Porospora cf. gigantea B TaxID=2853592 RepID=UPI003571E58E|nr:MAG: hypothetical protein KVP17_002937 [Porospora cf. gigantea B]